MKQARITGNTVIAAGKFISLNRRSFQDERGRDRLWESADRTGGGGAAFIFALTEPENELILVRQFRPPAGKYILEFPAGLIDGNESPAETSVRELYEETGYRGTVTGVHRETFSSPGLSGEPITMVEMRVNSAENLNPVSHQEDTEHIETVKVRLDRLAEFLETREKAGDAADSKLHVLATALRLKNL